MKGSGKVIGFAWRFGESFVRKSKIAIATTISEM